jgi:hypothetical protein
VPRPRGARPAPLALGQAGPAGPRRQGPASSWGPVPSAAHCRAGVAVPRPRARPAGPAPAAGLFPGAGRRPPAAVRPGPCPAEAEATRRPRPGSVSGRPRSEGLGPAEAAEPNPRARRGPGSAGSGRRPPVAAARPGRREESTPGRRRDRVAALPRRRAGPRRAGPEAVVRPEAQARPEAVERRRAPGPGPSPAGAVVTRRLRASPVSTPRWAPPCRAEAVASTPSATPARCLPAPRAAGRQP